MTLRADGLERGPRDARVGSRKRKEAAHPLHIVTAVLIEDRALAHDIVHDDERTLSRELYRPLEIERCVGLVGIDENKIERRFRASPGNTSSPLPSRTST
jgi:hypothetical protein